MNMKGKKGHPLRRRKIFGPAKRRGTQKEREKNTWSRKKGVSVKKNKNREEKRNIWKWNELVKMEKENGKGK